MLLFNVINQTAQFATEKSEKNHFESVQPKGRNVISFKHARPACAFRNLDAFNNEYLPYPTYVVDKT